MFDFTISDDLNAACSCDIIERHPEGCLSFIEDALEISNHIEIYGGDSAKESCEMYKDALRGGAPERGAFVFYDCLCPGENGPVNWGHCGLPGQWLEGMNVSCIPRGKRKIER